MGVTTTRHIFHESNVAGSKYLPGSITGSNLNFAGKMNNQPAFGQWAEVALGDVLHNSVQVHETDWVSRADIDPEQTRSTRHSVMERLERDGSLVAAVHLPAPGFGRVVRV